MSINWPYIKRYSYDIVCVIEVCLYAGQVAATGKYERMNAGPGQVGPLHPVCQQQR